MPTKNAKAPAPAKAPVKRATKKAAASISAVATPLATPAAKTRKAKAPAPVEAVGRAKAPAPGAAVAKPKAPTLVADLRKKLGVTQEVFARLVGHSVRSIASWEAGGTPDAAALRRIREIKRFQARLAGVVKAAYIPTWLATPNDAFDDLKPLEVIERGEIDRLWRMIYYLESGDPS